MRLKELISEIGLCSTSFQIDAKCQTFIGQEIEIIDEVKDVTEKSISLLNNSISVLNNYNKEVYYQLNLEYEIFYSKEKFGAHLITLLKHDEVKINAKITQLTSHKTDNNLYVSCKLELSSILRISTLKQREEEKEEASKISQTAAVFNGIGSGIAGAIAGIVIAFGVALVFEIGSCIHNGTEKGMNKYDGGIFLIFVVIGITGGGYLGYTSKKIRGK